MFKQGAGNVFPWPATHFIACECSAGATEGAAF